MDPSPGLLVFAVVLFLAFLLLLGTLAFASGKLLRRREGEGPGLVAGCLLTLALGAAGLFGFAVFAAVLLAVAADSLVERGPVRQVGLWIDDGPFDDWAERGREPYALDGPLALDPARPLHVIVDVEGDRPALVEGLRGFLEERLGEPVTVTTGRTRDAEGRDLVRLDFALPVEEAELEHLRAAIERWLDERADGAWAELALRRDW